MEWDGAISCVSIQSCRPDFLYFSLAPAMDTKHENPAPMCPHCADTMRRALTIPSSDALPSGWRSFAENARQPRGAVPCGVIFAER
jgi:hypothetical protein